MKQKTTSPANEEDNREAFWSKMEDLAIKGTNRPETLTTAEISSICQLALAGMTAWKAKQPR